MKRLLSFCAALLGVGLSGLAVAPQLGSAEAQAGLRLDAWPQAPATYFEAVQVVIDPQGQPLAAYQFELSSPSAQLTIVGLENGSHPAFADAPFYDTAAVASGRADRIVVAAYSLLGAEQLPHKPTRIATVMVQVRPDPGTPPNAEAGYQLKLIAAGNPAGEAIPATLDRGATP